MSMVYWDHYYDAVLLLNLLIVIVLFTTLRLFSGTIAHINASDELLRKDNPAFGISLAATAFAVTVMLSGIIYGEPQDDVAHSVMMIGLSGVVGIILMACTRIIFDKITLSAISLRDEIMKGNKAVAIADAGNVLAVAVIIQAIMVWITLYSMNGILVLLGGYIISQCLMTLITKINIKTFEIFNKNNNFQDELKNRNIALALRFAGQKIGIAFAIATAAKIVLYDEHNMPSVLVAWFCASLLAILIWKMICVFAEKVILFRVNTNHEVVIQRNIAIGALEAVIYISIGLLISRI